MNKITIIGCLGKDPEVRTISTGQTVCSFSVAVSSKHKGEDVTTWFRVSAWEKLADVCARFLAKGRKVAVVGPVSVSSYEAKDGGTRFSLDVRAEEVEFLGAKEQGDAAEPPAKAQPKPAPDGFTEVDDTEDLPF